MDNRLIHDRDMEVGEPTSKALKKLRDKFQKDSVYTASASRDGGRLSFFGTPAVAPCRLAGSAHHKCGGRRVKS